LNILETIAVAFSMYSAVPMPQFSWNAGNMKYSLCAFPLVGLLTGLLCWLIYAVLTAIRLPQIFTAAVLTAVPVLITGGIHIDGYADTQDALSSHADRDKKLVILSDPHIGSFAVIRICISFIITFACWASLRSFAVIPLIICFCQSRVLSALAVSAFPLAKNTGLAYAFADAMDRQKVKKILCVIDIILVIIQCICGISGLAMTLACHIVFAYYYFMSKKNFGGITGDLAGWFLVQSEKIMLLVLVLVQFIF